MKKVTTTTIQFPGIRLATRDAHKLRGYFGEIFRDHSPLLHNHYETGDLRYKYPLVQYKVLNGIPTLVAIDQGSELLTSLFLKIQKLELSGVIYQIQSKNIQNTHTEIGHTHELHEYRFDTLWMALNQNNYNSFSASDEIQKHKLLNKILIGNILSLLKGLGIRLNNDERLMANVKVTEKQTRFKDKTMVAFSGGFVTNAQLPANIGLGKSVSRGFGSISPIT